MGSVLEIGLRVRGEARLFESIDRLIEVVSDQRERGWQPNVDVRLDFERRYLDTEGAGGFVPLTPAYAAEKAAKVGFVPVLQYSKRMYRSLTEEGASNFVREEGADFLRVGSSDPKARYHHAGAGSLPVREVMKATDEEGKAQLQVFRDSYAATSRALGFKVI
jgi:hypothetical protein